VTDVTRLVRDPVQKEAFLHFVKVNLFKDVTLYHLAPLLGEDAGADQLAQLFRELRAAGVRSIAAPIASTKRVTEVLALRQRNKDARFDALVTEYEYWRQCAEKSPPEAAPIRTDCFAGFADIVQAMKQGAASEAAAGFPLRIGAYLGRSSRSEIEWLSKQIDFAYLIYPFHSPEEAWTGQGGRGQAIRDRLRWSAQAGLEVWPIFYSRGEVPMQPWLDEHSLAETEKIFFDRVKKDARLAPVAKKFSGVQYFADDGFKQAVIGR
jgi:hypothetical protein